MEATDGDEAKDSRFGDGHKQGARHARPSPKIETAGQMDRQMDAHSIDRLQAYQLYRSMTIESGSLS